VSVRIRGEIEMGFARHDDMRPAMQRCNGQPVRRIQAGLCREKRPGTEPGPKVRVCSSRLYCGKHSEQQDGTNRSS
jgi:hypothetical protein